MLYGGVVPELASRAHIAKIVPVVQKALAQAGITASAIEAVAATYGPGLVGSLMVGLTFAKGFALSRKIPFLGINHLEGHLFSAMLEFPGAEPPFLGMVVSGGHTLLVRVHDVGRYEILGQTRDDAAGEAFDKVAKILHLPYPGGPAIEQVAREGNVCAIKFPVAKMKVKNLDFSFSGLKTAVLYFYNSLSEEERQSRRADIAAAFQHAVCEALMRNLRRAVKRTGSQRVVLAGGVARNGYLRAVAEQLAGELGFQLFVPSAEYCTDNAAMIGQVAALQLQRGETSALDLAPVPNLALSNNS